MLFYQRRLDGKFVLGGVCGLFFSEPLLQSLLMAVVVLMVGLQRHSERVLLRWPRQQQQVCFFWCVWTC